MRAKINKLLSDHSITIYRWQFDLVVLLYILLGLVIGILVVSFGVIPRAGALIQVNLQTTSDTQFSAGALTSTVVSGTGNAAFVQLAGSAPADAWYDTDWLYRRKITFDNSAQAENLTNFPALVTLDNTDIDFAKVKAAGADIRFTDSDGSTLLSHEIELWDDGTENAVVWVKVPQINASSNTDYIYLYYGNTAATDSQNASAVWSNGYAGVWHMNQNPGGTAPQILDSTSNARHLTSAGSMAADDVVDAKIGKGLSFDGTNDYLSIPLSGLNFDTGHIEIWIQKSTTPFRAFFRTDGSGCDSEFYLTSNTAGFWTNGSCAAGTYEATTSVGGATGWNHTSFQGRSDGNTIFINGLQVSPNYVQGNASRAIFLDDFASGATLFSLGTAGDPSEFWNGIMDEFRISNTTRSGAWIAAQYTNMNGGYVSYGSEETPLPASGTWESSAGVNVIDLVWNGGWGDGTAGSTAFTANFQNVGANATITFQARVATTTGGLASASYQTLGIANSGTSLTIPASTFTSLSLGTGTNRYIQIRATFANVDGVTNPRLDDFTISYMGDNSAPDSNASTITMQKTQGGATVASNGWTNSESPYFSWNAGLDSQSGIRGYCLYLGTDAAGDPTVSKGLLGTSPAALTGTPCLFVVTGTNIDFVTTSLRGSTWLTSSTSPYYLNIRAVDLAGNVFGSSAQFQFRFDNQAPTNPAFLSLPSGFISTKDATFTWPTSGPDAASDTHSGFAGLQYRVTAAGVWYGDAHNGAQDPTDFLTNDGSYTTDPTYDYPLLSDGTNVIYMRTWDVAGNVSVVYTTGSLKINTAAPSAPQNLQVTPTDNTANSYSFDWDQPATFVGDVNLITYCYTVNVVPAANTCSFTAAGVTSLAADAYANQPGTNTLFVVAKDEAGNINYGTSASVNFTYSGSAPGIPTSIDVADISVKATSNWRLVISWSAPTNVGAGIENYQILRSTTNTTCTTNLGAFTQVGTTQGTSFTDGGLSQQNYYYCVKACDSANSCSAASETRSGFPDGRFTEPPNLISGPTITRITNRSATITWVTDRNSDTKVSYGLSTGQYFQEEPAKSEQVTNHTITLNNLQPGTTYFFRAKWLDEDGNLGTSEEAVLTTLPAPVVSEVTVTNVGLNNAFVRFTATRAARVRVQFGTTTNFGGLNEIATSQETSSYITELSGLQDGTKYYFRVDPVDADGFSYPGTTLDLSTIARPRISNIEAQEVKGEPVPTVEVSWETNTETTSIITYYPESAPQTVENEVDADFIQGERKLRLTALQPDTNYLIQVRGRDKFGNEALSEIQRITTSVDTRAPRITNLRIEGAVISQGATLGGQPLAQLIVSWDTDEPATSQIEFGEGTGTSYTQRTQKDGSLTFNHLVVISKLQPSQVYHLQVSSEDSAGNLGQSVDTVTITPKATQTAVEVVLRNLGDIFSFLR